GLAGFAGAAGFAGLAGFAGDAGFAGLAGFAGDAGFAGLAGFAGAGAAGDAGAGAAGAGAAGAPGAGTGVGVSGSALDAAGNAMVTTLALVAAAIASDAHNPLRRVGYGST
ncbi:hypothetical protein, partial [Mycobacterium kiyosense]|uniref:hypothetical protein n=1 Tax=Mycobacterium kiyosense TaxID=2871094 RepID=UPI0040397BB1